MAYVVSTKTQMMKRGTVRPHLLKKENSLEDKIYKRHRDLEGPVQLGSVTSLDVKNSKILS